MKLVVNMKKNNCCLLREYGAAATTVVPRSTKMIWLMSSSIVSSLLWSQVLAVRHRKVSTTTTHHKQKMAHGSFAANVRKRPHSNFFDAMALSYNSNESKEKMTGNSSRQLKEGDGLLATRTFPECIDQGLNPVECQSLIQSQIDDAGGHEVGQVNVKIHTPRTPEQFADSYWMVEVPVNLYAKMTCDRNDGKTFYPLKWMDGVTGTALDVEDQNCFGLSAGECCLKLRRYGKHLTMSGYDEHKQCLSCFVHQEPLEPVLNKVTGKTDYLECKELENGKCVREQLTGAEVAALDIQTVGRIEAAIESLESFQTNRSCDTFDQLLEKLYNAASVIHPLSMKIGRLACMVCYGAHDLELEDNFVTFQLAEILMMMKKHSPPAKSIDSKENCIIIYTNADGEIVKDPTLGGGRADMTGKQIVRTPGEIPTVNDDGYYYDDGDVYYDDGGVSNDDGGINDDGNFYYDDDPFYDDDEFYGPCYSDPLLCADTEWCDPYGYCLENVCITNPPEDCQGENQICVPKGYYDVDNSYRCADIDCKMDPSLCKENEACITSGYDYYTGYETYTCEVYKEPGEACGFSYYGYYFNNSIFDGECDPDIAFCSAPLECTSTYSSSYSRECVVLGEGSCFDENGELTQSNCKNDEYCDYSDDRCKPNRNKGECCDPKLNNCGIGSALGTLICAPDKNYVDNYGYVNDFYICQDVCNTNDDCGTNEWCAPVDELEDDLPNFPGKFCKEYKGLGDYCHIKLPGLIDKELHTEERCDPSTSYCYDPKFCLTYSEYFFQSECRSYGNECTSDADCVDAATEWCDVDVGFCKDRSNLLDCCTTVGDGSKSDCPPGSSCELHTTSDEYYYYYYNNTYYKYYNTSYYHNVGAATCTEP